jgi:hypothetical protein
MSRSNLALGPKCAIRQVRTSSGSGTIFLMYLQSIWRQMTRMLIYSFVHHRGDSGTKWQLEGGANCTFIARNTFLTHPLSLLRNLTRRREKYGAVERPDDYSAAARRYAARSSPDAATDTRRHSRRPQGFLVFVKEQWPPNRICRAIFGQTSPLQIRQIKSHVVD